jgi:hypothetical protein
VGNPTRLKVIGLENRQATHWWLLTQNSISVLGPYHTSPALIYLWVAVDVAPNSAMPKNVKIFLSIVWNIEHWLELHLHSQQMLFSFDLHTTTGSRRLHGSESKGQCLYMVEVSVAEGCS